jgi:KDO2-lipid IV(A) lauroyltransferase
MAQAIGAALGWLVFLVSPTYRQRFLANSRLAGFAWPQVSAAVANAGRMVSELPWLWLRPDAQSVLPLLQWQGEQHFEVALQARRGVLLVTPHLGSWEMAAQALAERYGPEHGPLVGMYRPPRKAWLVALMVQARNRRWLKAITTSVAGVRSLVKALRAGGYTLLAPDQVPPLGQGVWADFFGRPAYTMNLLARLAQATGAAVVLAWCERLPPGQGFVMHFEPWTGVDLADAQLTPQAAALAINQAMEHLVRRCPGQYLWSYARYKMQRTES